MWMVVRQSAGALRRMQRRTGTTDGSDGRQQRTAATDGCDGGRTARPGYDGLYAPVRQEGHMH